MAFVITESCINCRHTDCVDICPVDCFHAGPNFLVIDPCECIDCGICVNECPENAIVSERDLDECQEEFIILNRELSKYWPVITKKVSRMPDALEWSKVSKKRHLLDTGNILKENRNS
jgi:ferredoxin